MTLIGMFLACAETAVVTSDEMCGSGVTEFIAIVGLIGASA
jgi:hypothetical protein